MTSTERGDMPVPSQTPAGQSFGSRSIHLRPRPRSRRGLVAVVMLVLAALAVDGVGVSSASAAEPYGEVARFGGYEAKASVPGKLAEPVGFAVDPESDLVSTPDHNAVFVLDLIENRIEVGGGPGKGKGTLHYRLQELSSSGQEVGHATIVESYTDTEHFTDAHPLLYLAVDPVKKRVYAAVESVIETKVESESSWVPVLDEVVAWNTEPNGSGELQAASGLPTDSVTNSAALVSGAGQLLGSGPGKDIYAPEGLAVASSSHNIAVLAQDGVTESERGKTVLDEIASEEDGAGKVTASWEPQGGTRNPGTGVFASTEGAGGLGVSLYSGEGEIDTLMTTNENLGEETPLAPGHSGVEDLDEAVSIGVQKVPNFDTKYTAEGKRLVSEVNAAGSTITQLIGGDHLYAALYGQAHEGARADGQGLAVDPWAANGNPELFWLQGGPSDQYWGNMGIRLFESSGRIVGTIGGGEPKAGPTAGPSVLLGSCDIDVAEAGLAAGAGESVFALTQPKELETESGGAGEKLGDEIIEFAPGGRYKCPSASGNIEVDGKEVEPEDGEPVAKVAVQEGVPIKFDAFSLDRLIDWNPPTDHHNNREELVPLVWGPVYEWTPFVFDWSFGDGETATSEMKTPEYDWPSPEVEHVYEKPGAYEVKVSVYGDFGTDVFPVKVQVFGATPPKAEFLSPSSIVAGETVTFDGVASESTPGAEIEDYEWNFGDGSKVVNSVEPQVKHEFTTPGERTVKLTIHDDVGNVREASVEHQVVVAESTESSPGGGGSPPGGSSGDGSPSPSGGGGGAPSSGGGSSSSSGGSSSGGGSFSGSGGSVKSVAKPLTDAQKLANALKACKKLKSKKQRSSCEKQARKRYASKPKAKKIKKK